MQCNIAPGDLVPFLYRSGRGAAAAREAPLRSYRRRRFVVAYAVRASQKKSIILREVEDCLESTTQHIKRIGVRLR